MIARPKSQSQSRGDVRPCGRPACAVLALRVTGRRQQLVGVLLDGDETSATTDEPIAILTRRQPHRGTAGAVEPQRVGASLAGSRSRPDHRRRDRWPCAGPLEHQRSSVLHHRPDRARRHRAPCRRRREASSPWWPPRCDSSARSSRRGRPSARGRRPRPSPLALDPPARRSPPGAPRRAGRAAP